LPSDYWEPYSEIDYGIYRQKPSENQIKSDLQYYNKYYDQYGNGYDRNIKALAPYAEGPNDGSNLPTAWNTYQGLWGWYWITPSEVENLWYSDYDLSTGVLVQIFPKDMIILATVCNGYAEVAYESDDNDYSTTPHMTQAFVDVGSSTQGAAAFVGATVDITGVNNDDFTDDFWEALCMSDPTVYQTTQDYIDSYNNQGWTDIWIYDLDIKIYGSTNAVLNN